MAKHDWHILAKEQRLAACILFGIALAAWLGVAIWQSHHPDPSLPEPPAAKRYRTWEERRDSMERADSIRYAQWAKEREQRYDSFRVANSIRHEEWKAERQQWYDSVHKADSIWRDSMGIYYAKRVKKDTILDLNHCDTTELQYIRGIGRYTAIQIVRYREQLGGYYSPSQLKDEALSRCHLDTLLRHFIADSTAIRTIPVNTSSVEVLQRHPYLRYTQAKAIYTLRRNKIQLHSIEELRSLPDLDEATLMRIAPYLNFD